MSNYKPSSRPKFLRGKLLIFPKFQLKLIGANLAIILSVTLITWVQLSRTLSELGPMAGLAGVEADLYRKYLAYQVNSMHFSLGLSLVIGLVLSTLLTLIISHRFSGPLVRLRHYFRAITSGVQPVPRLEFRRGDLLDDIPPLVNSAVETLQRREEEKESA